MKLYIKQKVFTLTEDFSVTDENNEPVFRVTGSFMRIPKKYEIYDMNGSLVCEIEKHLFRLFSHFDIRSDSVQLTVKKDFTFFKTAISIVGSDWRLIGDIFNLDFALVSGNYPIMSFRKAFLSWGDFYELDISDEKDAILCLAIVIVIDRIIAENQRAN